MVEDNDNQIPYQLPMHMLGSNILHMTNPAMQLKQLEYAYKGKVENQDGTMTDYGNALMNERGINNVVGLLRSTVNQVNIMGNLEKEDIPKLMQFFADALIKDLMLNKYNYNMTWESRNLVYTSAINLAYYTMKRSLNEGDRRFWKGSVQEISMKQESNTKGGGGILSKLNPWKKD
jgi:hypothetical protein